MCKLQILFYFLGEFVKWQLIIYGVDTNPMRLREPGKDYTDDTSRFLSNAEGMKNYGHTVDLDDYANQNQLRPNIQNYRNTKASENIAPSETEVAEMYDILYNI